MDAESLCGVSGLRAGGWRDRRVQRQVDVRPVGAPRRFVRDAVRPTEIRHHLWLGNFRHAEFRNLLTPAVAADLAGVDPLAPVNRYAAECQAQNDLNRVLYLDMKP